MSLDSKALLKRFSCRRPLKAREMRRRIQKNMPLSRTASVLEAIQRYCPRSVIAKGLKPAEVLVPIHERAGEHYLTLIKRAATLRSHGGEIAFPGGNVTGERYGRPCDGFARIPRGNRDATPLNIYSAIHRVQFGGHSSGPWYLAIRLPLQVLLFVWTYWFTLH